MHTHIQPPRDTDPGLCLDEATPIRMPARLMVYLLGIVAVGAIAWSVTARSVADNTKRIDSLEAEARTSRELLTRIDERTAAIKERLDRPGR